jgi:membrane protein implicated in regulation of membrane protease activity
MPTWPIWLIIAAVLGALESVSLTFVLSMFAGGALVAAVAAALGASDVVQVGVFLVSSLLLVALVRPVAVRHLRRSGPRMGADALVGQHAVVLSSVDAYDGRVRLNGGEWSARTLNSETLEVGSVVEVVKIDGATAVVRSLGGEPQ